MNLITIIVIKLYNNMTTNNLSILAYELINERYSRAKYLGNECIMETKTGFINATKFCTTAGDGKKRFDSYLRLDRYKNLFNYMSSAPQFCGAEIAKKYEGGNPELRGTYVHPDLLLDLASWISPAAYVRASGIVKNFLIREKEDEIRRLSGDKCRLEIMLEKESIERREAEKRAEQMLLKMTLQNEQTHIKLDNTEKILENTNIKLDNTEKTLENTNVKLDTTEKTLENTNAKLGNTEKTLEQTNLSLENTNVKLDNTEKILEKTHIKLDKTKKTLERVEARVELLVDEVVPPAKKVSLHEQFGIMKLNDSDGKREYKVYCVQKRGVLKARASIMKEYPNAMLIKEVNPNANSKNFLHKLKEKYGTGKKSKIQVSYNFVNLKEGATEEQLKEMIDEVVEAALRYGVN